MTTYCANVGDVVGDKIIFEEIKNDSKIPVYSTLQIPTAEQMIGWLEEKGVVFELDRTINASNDSLAIWYEISVALGSWKYDTVYHPNRKDAKLAAINVALDFLEKGGR